MGHLEVNSFLFYFIYLFFIFYMGDGTNTCVIYHVDRINGYEGV
jgi:hypothetical protein